MNSSFLTFAALIAVVVGEACIEPKVTSKSFTTEDATIVTNIAYVTEFSVECGVGVVDNLYADIDGYIQPVSVTSLNSYQVSWTEEATLARSGQRTIRVFDEDGYTAVRKAIRNGLETTAIKEFFTITINHPGAFTGPWLKSEFLAATLSVLVAYLAFTSRSKLLS